MASIYDEIGGKDAVAAAVDIFYVRVLDDPVLAPWFRATDMRRQKGHMRAFMAAALGGPQIYAGRDMGAAHAGMGITDAAFDRVVGHLVATLGELGVPLATIGAIGEALAPLRAQVVEHRAAAA
jgi:hemoglobin